MSNWWESAPVVSAFDEALSAEGVSGQLADLARSIYEQESGSGRNSKTSNAGAVGGMQILADTFREVADKDWDINNPLDNARAGIRYLKKLADRVDGDPILTAVGYYGGPGGQDKARRGEAVSDPRNPKAPNTLEYARQVVSRMGASGSEGEWWKAAPVVEGSTMVQPESSNALDLELGKFAKAKKLEEKAANTKRSGLDIAGDLGLSVLQGAMDVAALPALAYEALGGSKENLLRQTLNRGQDAARDLKSDASKARQEAVDARMATAQNWREALALGIEAGLDPMTAAETVARMFPQMLAGGGVGQLVGKGVAGAANLAKAAPMAAAIAGRGAGVAEAAASAVGAASQLAGKVAASPVGRFIPSATTAGAVGFSGATQGDSVGNELYSNLLKAPTAAWESGVPEFSALRDELAAQAPDGEADPEAWANEEAKRRLARGMSLDVTGKAALISLGANALPGGSSIERFFAGQAVPAAARKSLLSAGVRGSIAEGFVSEPLEEGGGEFVGASAMQQLDPSIDPVMKAAAAAGQAVVTAGPMGAVSGVREGMAANAEFDRQARLDAERAKLQEMRTMRERAKEFVAEKQQQAVNDIGAQTSVDGAIAAANRAVNIDSDQLLNQALASVGIDNEALKRVDAAESQARVAEAEAAASPAAPDATLMNEGTTQAPIIGQGVNQIAQPGNQMAEPARVWYGRRGDGYATTEDAERGLKERTRIQSNLDWKIEPTPEGKFRLAGYAPVTQQTTVQQPSMAVQQQEVAPAMEAPQAAPVLEQPAPVRIAEWQDRESVPPGTWVKADYKTDNGQPIEQVRELALDALYLPELTNDGRLQPEKRKYVDGYTERLRNGEAAPSITVIETEDGRMRVVDGHRRVMAARAAGRDSIRALVSPLIDTPDGKREATVELLQKAAQNPPPAQQTPAVAAAETVAPTTPIQLGRDQTPLAEGGKPFKTRTQAAEAKKLQPMMRVVSVPGGYALAEKTPAQIAAQEKAAQRLRQARTSPKGEPIPAHAFIAANGGMQYSTKSDMGVDGNPRIGNRSLFAAAGRGLSIERATEMLVAEGYLSQGASHNDAYALIKKSLTQPQYNADGIERIAEMESAAQFEDYLAAQEEMERDPWEDVPAILEEYTADELQASGYDAAPDAIKAEVQALLEMADARGIDGESILLQAHEQTRNATEQDYYEAAKSALEAAIQGGPGNRSTPTGRQGEEGTSEEIDDDGITVRPGKGAIKDKFFAIVNGDTIPGGPFNTEAEAFDAGIEWRKNQAERAAQDTNERARRERIAQKFIRGEPVSSAEIESLDMRAGTSDMRWFMSRAASLFGLNARDIRPIVKDMIRVSLTDMGAKREFVPTRQALEAIASKVKADGALTAPTRADILASQERAGNDRALQAREQIRRESEAGAGLFELTMEDGRQDTTGALFSLAEDPAPKTPVAAIRSAIDKAYPRLLGRLEAKRLVTLTQTEEQAIEAAAQARAAKTGGDVEEIRRALMGGAQGEADLDFKRSANGAIEGFFDPQIGKSFLIADGLTTATAPGTLMHEVGIHMAADGKMQPLFDRSARLVRLGKGNRFFDSVRARMESAGETSPEEAAAYIVTEYENNRANAPQTVLQWLKDVAAAVRAWLFSKGVIIQASSLTAADIAAVARANAKRMADGTNVALPQDRSIQESKSGQPSFYDGLRDRVSDGRGYREDELLAAYVTGHHRWGYIHHRGGTSAVQGSIATAYWEGAFAGHEGYYTAAIPLKQDGQPTLLMAVFPLDALTDGSPKDVSRAFRERKEAWYLYATETPDGTWEIGTDGAGPGYANYEKLIASGELTPINDGYHRLKLPGGTTEWDLLREGTRRLSMFLDGETPTVRFVRATGANPGKSAKWTPERLEAKFSRQRTAQPQTAGYTLPEETALLKKRRQLQDYFLRVKKVQEAVAKQGGVVNETTDTYLAEELSHGRTAALLEDFAKNQVEPLMKKAVELGVDLDELALFAYAKHAPERNAQIARIDSQLPDGGSGMTNADANAIINQARQDGTLADLEDLHRDLMAITRANREAMLREGLITQDEYDALTNAYQNYIPLRGFEQVDEDGKRTGLRAGKGFNIRGKETMRAMGRTSRAGLLIENAIADYQRTIVRAERNQVAKVFLNFVVQNPDADLWEIDATTTRKSIDRQTGRVARSTVVDKGEDTIAVKVNGVEIYVRIKDELLLRAMRKAHKDETGEAERFLIQTVGAFTGFLRDTLTRYNPEFAVVNAMRDAGFGATAMLDELGEKGAAKFAAHYAGAIAASSRNERNKLDPKARDWDKWFVEFKAAGGTTMGFYAKGAEEVAKDVREVLLNAGAQPKNLRERLLSNKPARGVKAVLRVMEYAGAVSENAARVAAYRTAREMGKTPAQAASIAKNLTTNFDRKGEFGQAVNALYMFFNAAVQGSHRTLKMLGNKKVLGYMAGMTAASIGMALWMAGLGGEDEDDGMAYWDKIPAHVKERNFIIMLPPGGSLFGEAQTVGKNGRYFAIPAQYGLNLFHLLGYQIADVIRNQRNSTRGVSIAKASVNMASAVAGAFNPFGGAVDLTNGSSIAQAVLPTAGDVVVQLATGTNAFGRDVAPYKSPFDDRPDSENVNLRQQGSVSHRIAQWINTATGGDEYEAGAVDISPGTVENIIGSLTGGSGRFVYDSVNLAAKSIESAMGGDPDILVREAPMLRRIYGELDGDTDQALFYERRRAVNEARGVQKRREEAGLEMTNKEKEAMASLSDDASQYTSWLSDIRKEMMAAQKDAEITDTERKTRLRELRKERDTLTAAFNKAWMGVMQEYASSTESVNR